MIQVVPQLRILVALDPLDFRKGIDSIAAVCRLKLQQDPFCGALFLFRNRRGTAIKLLCYDGSGYWLCHKRFSEGRLRWWPKQTGEVLTTLAAKQLQVLLYNGDPDGARMAEDWRKLP
jgi:transposase